MKRVAVLSCGVLCCACAEESEEMIVHDSALIHGDTNAVNIPVLANEVVQGVSVQDALVRWHQLSGARSTGGFALAVTSPIFPTPGQKTFFGSGKLSASNLALTAHHISTVQGDAVKSSRHTLDSSIFQFTTDW